MSNAIGNKPRRTALIVAFAAMIVTMTRRLKTLTQFQYGGFE